MKSSERSSTNDIRVSMRSPGGKREPHSPPLFFGLVENVDFTWPRRDSDITPPTFLCPFGRMASALVKPAPKFPERFGSLPDARSFCREFFSWYNCEHHHTGIGLLTPKMVHYGVAPKVIAARDRVLRAAYEAHPERFVRGIPKAPRLPAAVWINPPAKTENEQEATLPIVDA